MSYMKKPCTQCPFRNDVKPYLHPDRAEEIAYHASNPYNSFPCHKSLEYTDEENFMGEQVVDHHKAKECYGFTCLQINENGREPEGWSWEDREKIYEDAWDMTEAHQEEWDKEND